MNCLCCGKALNLEEETMGWHKRCIKKFFGTTVIPEIDINNNSLSLIATESINKGLTVPGVQKKLSLHLMSKRDKPRLTLVDYPTGYILKPQVEDFTALPEAEHLVMNMAKAVGINTVPHALIKMNNSLAYITKRVDRVQNKTTIKMLAMEDFCQLDLRLTCDKYKGSYERCAKVIKRYSSRVGLDMTELYMRLVFSYIVGNSDMHLKNFSLIETKVGSEQYIISPAYDLLPINIVMPEDKEEFALPMNGKKMNLRKKDFFVFAQECGISKASAEKMINKITSMKDNFIDMVKQSFLPEALKEDFIKLIEKRTETFI